MDTGSETVTSVGVGGRYDWSIGGITGGIVGAFALGVVLWLSDPTIVEEGIPAAYGLGPSAPIGWGLHLFHGAVVGLLFGVLVTRRPVVDVLLMDVETEVLSRTGAAARMVGAGFAFGLALWAIFPVLVVPLWAGVVGEAVALFPGVAVESLVGHLLFGVVLGTIFGITVDFSGRSAGETFE